ncbi:hypothetical protein GE09DRAFT_1294761 [Coniochaeta sp. 2T2.1]|nr:hypothetical protein GE09DRAFT_1294761 [Coniochaeta sp. 2T2.1]
MAQAAPVVVLVAIMLIAIAIWGVREIRGRRREEDLAPYLARMEERMHRRQLERELKRGQKRTKLDERKVAVSSAAAEGDAELMERLKKLRTPGSTL